ncbi:beta-ketoacyl-ACP synthase [Noviherbaspirillum saxi]|uniref:Beta-ketoacyl-ACP synthase n=1 Tax=Noviherbaspirillum saxi TaxID=2320863 RepID=A0A3A3FMI9_9BURK|nr:beta-ketoacyl-ACP synthase [Noviherbaspirillum saxi]RJF97216.1 beta-ketoacyl-ACP synthase [Noviherbaspirillum saxi]
MIYLNHLGILCAAGNSPAEVKRRVLQQPESGIAMTERYSPGRMLPLGCVDDVLPSIDHLPLAEQSRNNRLALAALAQIRSDIDVAIDRYGANRIGIVIGTSTSGIAESEAALREYHACKALPSSFHYSQQELASPASMLAAVLGISGPTYVHSTACASSAKAMASAARLLNMGICDAVLCGGIDSLCAFTVAGFAALESVSSTRCNPLSANRDGINIGEGAALFLMTREPGPVSLRGWGESSDAHHMSAPEPSGQGASLAIEKALARAGIAPSEIDYINLHGTATVQNDAMESHAVSRLFGDAVAVSSTKPFTGHALGAAGAIEAALCWLTMQDDNPGGSLPPHLWDGARDPAIPRLNLAISGASLGRPVRWCLSNSFAFGGANAALVFGRE